MFVKKNQIKKISGFSSIEIVLSMSIFILFLLLFISFLTYIIPKSEINSHVNTLSNICERQGGLTFSDINNFKEKLSNIEYIKNSEIPITVTAITNSDKDVTNVTPLNESGDNYVKRDSKEIIHLKVLIPSNSYFINVMTNIFGSNKVPNYYVFNIYMTSERY